MTKFLNISTDTTLGGSSASDSTVSSQKAIKAYVDNHSGVTTLGGLSDVTISNPTAGQNLTYDATNQVWKNTSTSATVAWGGITGTMSDQTDLKNALDAKYDASNPNGYTSNVGTVTSVNSVSPVNGNVTLSIPTVSDTYSATSSNAMSGKAVASAVSGYVPTSRTVNGKALSSNISLSASDVGALPDSTVIPTVNNATLTIQKNGTTVKTFTANASTDVTANITVPTKVSDLTNDSGFIAGITSSMVTTALGYTPYNSTNPSGYQANVIETVKVNGTALTVTSKAVDVTVPTKVSQLTNDSGYTTNTGTVTSVNNISPVNGNVTLSIPSTSNLADKDLSNLSSTGNAKFQAPLVSGTNIKTINNTSILGSGNISVSPTLTYDSTTETLTIS